MRIKHFIFTTAFLLSGFFLKAQEDELILGLRLGQNASLGNFAAVSLETDQHLNDSFGISGGLQYSTLGKTSIEARPAYIHDFRWGNLSAEVLLSYTNMRSVNSYAAGAGIGLGGKWVGVKFGYFYRMFGNGSSRITEPFNIYYELCLNLLPMKNDWKLDFYITNNEIFELERHYQPSFIAQCCYYPLEYLGVSLSLGCKPAGMFNMSADYYQSFLKLGVCYRW